MLINTVGSRIRYIRREIGLTQKQLAVRSGLLQSTVSGIERSLAVPSTEHLTAIATALGVEPADLMDDRVCEFCGFEFSYDEGEDSPAHHAAHAKAVAIYDRYGFYLPYRKRKIEHVIAMAVLSDPNAGEDAKRHAAQSLARCLFSRSVAVCPDGHPYFTDYFRMLLSADEYVSLLPQSVYEDFVADYGRSDAALTGTYWQSPAMPEKAVPPRFRRILDRLPFLPESDLQIIEYLCDRQHPTQD